MKPVIKSVFAVVILIFVNFQAASPEETTSDSETGPDPTVEEYYETVLELYRRYHEMDRAMHELTEENPVPELTDQFVKPLKSQMSDLSKQIKASYDLPGKEALKALENIRATYNSITNRLAEMDIWHSDTVGQGEKNKEEITAKVEELLADLRKAEALQKRLNFDESINSIYGGPDFDEDKMTTSTLIEVQVLKMSLGLIKDIPAALQQLKEENGEDFSLDKNLSKDEQADQLIARIMRKKNSGLRPAQLVPQMAKTIDEINEYFAAKVGENLEIFSEEYADHSKKIQGYWNKTHDKIEEFEKHIKQSTKDEL